MKIYPHHNTLILYIHLVSLKNTSLLFSKWCIVVLWKTTRYFNHFTLFNLRLMIRFSFLFSISSIVTSNGVLTKKTEYINGSHYLDVIKKKVISNIHSQHSLQIGIGIQIRWMEYPKKEKVFISTFLRIVNFTFLFVRQKKSLRQEKETQQKFS